MGALSRFPVGTYAFMGVHMSLAPGGAWPLLQTHAYLLLLLVHSGAACPSRDRQTQTINFSLSSFLCSSPVGQRLACVALVGVVHRAHCGRQGSSHLWLRGL